MIFLNRCLRETYLEYFNVQKNRNIQVCIQAKQFSLYFSNLYQQHSTEGCFTLNTNT